MKSGENGGFKAKKPHKENRLSMSADIIKI